MGTEEVRDVDCPTCSALAELMLQHRQWHVDDLQSRIKMIDWNEPVMTRTRAGAYCTLAAGRDGAATVPTRF
jgi:hypothetical protein